MLRSMYSGIGGMRNFQTKLDVIGNNIANVNTYGFKKGRTTFKDLVSQQLAGASSATATRGGTNPQQVGLGSTIGSIDTIHTQGSIQSTNRDLDIGISGDGFFIVNDGNMSYYTRAGNFYLDQYGNLVNADGLFVQGYGVDANGNIDYAAGIGNLEIAVGQLMEPAATDLVELRGNLNADEQGNVTVPFQFYDSLGRTHELNIVFAKTGDNEWTASVVGGGQTTQLGTFQFNSTGRINGNLQYTLNIANNDFGIDLAGADNLTINIDLSNMTQFARGTTADVYRVTGYLDGELNSYTISPTGEIYGVFSNGQARLLGQIALANFNNASGLTKSGNNLYEVSNNSGAPQIGVAGEGGRGTLIGAALEMSNVDLSEEFTEMIVAQRGFQANTRIITTSDEILQELVNLKR